MEYPTLVTTAADRLFTPPGVMAPEMVTVHEVGHNWFQGILASNEAEEAFLDEGFNEWADGEILDDWLGADRSIVDWSGLRLGYPELRAAGASLEDDVDPIATRSWSFVSNGAYSDATYGKTSLAMSTLAGMVGKERFAQAMHDYAQAWAFRHPTFADFVASVNRSLGADYSWFLAPAFGDTDGVDLRVDLIRARRPHEPRGVFGDGAERKTVSKDDAPDGKQWISEVVVTNVGDVPVDTTVLLRFEDGREERHAWPHTERFMRFEVEHSHKVVEVVIDPDRLVALEQEKLENTLRTISSAAASWRAAARIGFWEQTLFQIVGL